jgi:DNA processing protein
VVEAAQQSGSLITARLANDQGKEVFAIPGSIHSPLSKGCHQLIRQGAKLVESAQDILEELKIQTARILSPPLASGHPNHPLLDCLGFDPCNINTLCARSGLSSDVITAQLLQLELDGRVATLPGGLYQRLR